MDEQKPHKGLEDSECDALQHALNYGSQGRKCRAYGGIRSFTVTQWWLVWCNPPPWINILQGLDHFAHLFVATLGWARMVDEYIHTFSMRTASRTVIVVNLFSILFILVVCILFSISNTFAGILWHTWLLWVLACVKSLTHTLEPP